MLADPPLTTMDAVVKGTMDGIRPLVAIAATCWWRSRWWRW